MADFEIKEEASPVISHHHAHSISLFHSKGDQSTGEGPNVLVEVLKTPGKAVFATQVV